MTMKLKERIASVALFGFFLFALITARLFPTIPRMLPSAISILGIILSGVLFARTFLTGDEQKETREESAKSTDKAAQAAAYKKTAITILMFIAYVVLIRVIGFYVTSFLFIIFFSYMVDEVKHKYYVYPIVAAGVLAVIYAIFTLFLKISLPSGFLF